MQGSWRVIYRDGTELSQYNGAGEIPYRAINWPEVKILWLESQEIQESFEITEPPAGLKMSLRSRHFKTLANGELMCFMLVLSKVDEEASDESTDSVFYWFPNGVGHACRLFNCPDVGHFACQKLHPAVEVAESNGQLMPIHETLQVEASAQIE